MMRNDAWLQHCSFIKTSEFANFYTHIRHIYKRIHTCIYESMMWRHTLKSPKGRLYMWVLLHYIRTLNSCHTEWRGLCLSLQYKTRHIISTLQTFQSCGLFRISDCSSLSAGLHHEHLWTQYPVTYPMMYMDTSAAIAPTDFTTFPVVPIHSLLQIL